MIKLYLNPVFQALPNLKNLLNYPTLLVHPDLLYCFILGMFIDWIGIIFVMVPILAPIVPQLGFDPLWFAMMIIVNLQMSFLTPPFAYAIFFLKGAAAPELNIQTSDIIRGVIPFVFLMAIGLLLMIAFPQIILWLPSTM